MLNNPVIKMEIFLKIAKTERIEQNKIRCHIGVLLQDKPM